MRINDETLLREMRKDPDKRKRVNSYRVKYLKFNGQQEELLFNQGYDASTDYLNPFFVRVYDGAGSQIMSGSNSTIEGAYNSLIISLIQFLGEARRERNEARAKLEQVRGIVAPDSDDD